jgi:hypothetical protein
MPDDPQSSSTTSVDPVLARLQDQQKIIEAQSGIIKAYTPDLSGAKVTNSQLSASTNSALGGVLTRRTADAVADELAKIVDDFAQEFAPDKTKVRIICDLSVLGDLAFNSAAVEQICFLSNQISAFAETAPSDGPGEPQGGQPRPAPRFLPALVGLAVPAVVDLGAQLLAVLSQVIAGSYQLAGETVDLGSITGLDFSIGNALQRRKSKLGITIDRLEPPGQGPVYARLAQLAKDSTSVLQGAIDKAKEAVAAAADDKDKAAAAQAGLDRGNALATSIVQVATSLLTPPAGASVPPIARAEHGARMAQGDCLIVYAQAIDCGMDVITSERLMHDKWNALAGVSVEYAIFDSDGHALTAGTRTVIQRITGDLKKGLSDLDLEQGLLKQPLHEMKGPEFRAFSVPGGTDPVGNGATAASGLGHSA